MQITRGDIVRYSVLPGVIPRMRGLFASGFSHLAFFMAAVYCTVRLLPPDHPYLQPRNIGRFGVRHVIAQAANNLVLSRRNIDQIIIFFTILAGIVILGLQFLLFIAAIVMQQPALASASPGDLLTVDSIYNPGAAQDIVFILMDRIFGLRGIYESCISDVFVACTDLEGNPLPDTGGYPYPYHLALHSMLEFYSLGIFVVSVMIILYYVTSLVGELAVSGSPFGQRYNKTWLPFRLIMFLALLVPLNIGTGNGGLNGAQLIVFWTAKLGSNFATNGWGKFNEELSNSYLGETDKLIATGNFPEIAQLVKFMTVAKTCKIAEEMAYEHSPLGIQAYLIRDRNLFTDADGPDAIDFMTADFDMAMAHANFGNVTIRFGALNEEKYASQRGFVKPFCGELNFNIIDVDDSANPVSRSAEIQKLYYEILQDMWQSQAITARAECIIRTTMNTGHDPSCPDTPDLDFAAVVTNTYQQQISTAIPAIIEQQVADGKWAVTDNVRARGWGGAAIWFNRLAEINGEVNSAIMNIPAVTQYPMVLETIALQRQMNNENTSAASVFDPALADGEVVRYERIKDAQIAIPMYLAYKFWDEDSLDNSQYRPSNNVIIDAINLIFGTSGIFDMRSNTDIHPLAQLTSLGKVMMDAAVRNIGVGTFGSALSKLFRGVDGGAGIVIGSFLTKMGMVTLAMAFVLAYVLPFMPFIYFFFAVSGWIKSIFEAIVAMPLWALSFLHLDGEGLPGRTAANGCFLILDIFLRPIMIVIGMLGAITIFSGLVKIMNQVFSLLVANVGGSDSETFNDFLRGPIDEFFYTAMYVIICYMLGLSCFKLIDTVPNQILRWMNFTVPTFQESAGDPAGETTAKAYQGALLANRQVSGGALALLGR